MAKLTLIDKKAQVDSWTIVKLQLMLHCELNKINISEADTNALVQLVKQGETELSSFCIDASSDSRMFKSAQSVRNFVSKAEKQNLIVKSGNTKKRIKINPELGIVTNADNIMLDYKLLCRDFKL
jgi:hypothetical protein